MTRDIISCNSSKIIFNLIQIEISTILNISLPSIPTAFPLLLVLITPLSLLHTASIPLKRDLIKEVISVTTFLAFLSIHFLERGKIPLDHERSFFFFYRLVLRQRTRTRFSPFLSILRVKCIIAFVLLINVSYVFNHKIESVYVCVCVRTVRFEIACTDAGLDERFPRN